MHSFPSLCQAFCALQGLPVPEVNTGRDGLQAFTLDVGDCGLTVLHDARALPRTLFLVAELGRPGSPGAELQGWRALLQANYWLRSDNPPTFSRNPQTGEAVFQWTLPFIDTSAVRLHEAVTTMTRLVRCWALPEGAAATPPPGPWLGAFA